MKSNAFITSQLSHKEWHLYRHHYQIKITCPIEIPSIFIDDVIVVDIANVDAVKTVGPKCLKQLGHPLNPVAYIHFIH